MSLFSIITIISLIIPIFLGKTFGKEFLGVDFPIFFGLILQAVLGSIIILYTNHYEKHDKNKVFLGYFLFFLGLTGSYLAGKTIWLCIFWEVSTLGTFLIYLGQGYSKKAIKSILALFFASSISMSFLAAWIFLPESNISYSFFIFALLLKASFSFLHIWLPEAHSGPPAHGSAAYSGLMINLPLLLFARYASSWWEQIPNSHYLIPIAGVGVFLGGIASFFSKDAKKSLAYSTVENANFLWMFLFLSSIWINSNVFELKTLSQSFLVLFYLMLLHHSFSKIFQFLTIGYICKIAGSTIIDSCKGVGRFIPISSAVLGIGTFSFAVIPGTLGFIAESTLLFLISRTIDLPNIADSILFLLGILFSISGMLLGSAAHIRLYLPMVLSVPSKEIKVDSSKSYYIHNSIKLLGLSIFLLPSIIFIIFMISKNYASCNPTLTTSCNSILPYEIINYIITLPSFLSAWLFKVSLISFLSFLFFLVIYIFRFSHKIEKRNIWDCGSEYRGSEVSIPSSVISDPLYNSMGRYFIRKDGEPYIDQFIKDNLIRVLNLGKYWIQQVESGEISYYILFSALSFILSIFVIISIKAYI